MYAKYSLIRVYLSFKHQQGNSRKVYQENEIMQVVDFHNNKSFALNFVPLKF
jgi:hypothetical protein